MLRLLSCHHSLQVLDYICRLVHRYRRGPAGSNTVSPINKRERQNREVIGRLNRLAFLLQEREHVIVHLIKEVFRHRAQLCEDISCAGCSLATIDPRTELAIWHKEINIIASYIVLSQRNNRSLQRSLSVVVS